MQHFAEFEALVTGFVMPGTSTRKLSIVRCCRLNCSISGAGDTIGEQFTAALDPSGCEAFASPTAYYCLRFVDDDLAFNEFLQMLKSFNIKVCVCATDMCALQNQNLTLSTC